MKQIQNTRPILEAARSLPAWLQASILTLVAVATTCLSAKAADAPTITSFSPPSGAGGDTVTLNGTNFTPPFSVTFAGNVSAAGSFTSTQITVTVPSGAQTGPITVANGSGNASTASNFTVVAAGVPAITSSLTMTGVLGEAFTYQIAASYSPMSYAATGLPAGLTVDQGTGSISGSPTALGTFNVTLSATNNSGTGNATLVLTISPLPFFTGETVLGNGVYYLAFPNGNIFGYYGYLSDARYLYHFDLGYEYALDAADGNSGVYLYDFKSGHFFYTSPAFGFPYLYDFSLNTTLYYYPDPSNPGRYNTNGVRYFYDFAAGQIITQ